QIVEGAVISERVLKLHRHKRGIGQAAIGITVMEGYEVLVQRAQRVHDVGPYGISDADKWRYGESLDHRLPELVAAIMLTERFLRNVVRVFRVGRVKNHQLPTLMRSVYK